MSDTFEINRICAGIVTYNPDISLLQKCINSIINQVSTIFVIDNNSNNVDKIDGIITKNKCIFIKNSENKGIAFALNEIAYQAQMDNYRWFLTLDQDSICPSDMIARYEKYLDFNNVGMLCPNIKLRINKSVSFDDNSECHNDYDYVDTALTSGSLVNIDAWKRTNGFWEYLFIDKVDDDFCYSLIENGWKILRIKSVIMEHEIGNPVMHRFLWKNYYTDSYPPFRYYYLARNNIIVYSCHANTGYNSCHIIIKRLIKIVFGESNKIAKLKYFITGIYDARKWMKNYGERGVPFKGKTINMTFDFPDGK